MESIDEVVGAVALASAFFVLVAVLVRREERHRDPEELAFDAQQRAERDQRAREARARSERVRAERANAEQVRRERMREDQERAEVAARSRREHERELHDREKQRRRADALTRKAQKAQQAADEAALAVFLRDHEVPH